MAYVPLLAQDAPQAPSQDYAAGGPFWKNNGKKAFKGANLSLEERQRLAAAREKAKDEPTVRSLREAKEKVGDQLAAAMRAAMLAADPTLGPALDKIEAARDRAKETRERFRSLTPEQRQQLKAARQKAKDDPAVQAARQKLRAAEGAEARRAAAREMRETMKTAMLKSDPSLASLLEQLGPRGPGGADRPPRPDMDESTGEPDPDQF